MNAATLAPLGRYGDGLIASKFWKIERSGKSFTTTYGRIGSSGQTTFLSVSCALLRGSSGARQPARRDDDALFAASAACSC